MKREDFEAIGGNGGIMIRSELDFEREARRIARARGWVACKVEKNGHKGIPDDLFISPAGACVLIEFKRDAGAHVRKEQIVWAERFPRLVRFARSMDEFLTILKEFENG